MYSGRTPLNALGEEDALLTLSDEEAAAALPSGGSSDDSMLLADGAEPTSVFGAMAKSHAAYFQFAYDGGLTESEASSRKNSCEDDNEEAPPKGAAASRALDLVSLPLEPAKQKLLAEVRAQDWQKSAEVKWRQKNALHRNAKF